MMTFVKKFLVGVSLIVVVSVAGCTKENHEQKVDSASNSVRGPNDFTEEAQKLDNREPKRVPVDPQRTPTVPESAPATP